MKKTIELNELKKIEIDLLTKLDKYCSEHGLRYYITYGTLIGAVRHRGFIPWDDDIDVIMPRKDYEQLIQSFNYDNVDSSVKVISHKLDAGYCLPIAKLIETRTVLKEKTDTDVEIGVYIDIFPLENLSDDYEEAKKRMKKGFIFNEKIILKTVSISPTRSKRKNLILWIGKLVLKGQSISDIVNRLDQYCKETESDGFTKYVGVICGISAGDSSRVFKREWFDNPIYAPFETVQLKVPGKLHEFLTERFGDYMKPPSPDRIKYEQHAESWDLNKQYKVSDDYLDEWKLI